jgi:glycerophosphoryl diester phosphodiesterase
VRRELRKASAKAHVAVVANKAEEFPTAVADAGADWVYVRFLPTREQIESARRSGKKVFIAGPTVSDNVPANWQHSARVGIDGILTDYPLELRTALRKDAAK